ncbi:MAG: hypothetical protein DHS20C09_01200 [marine bacterium B5-7]|nr:MAG: hypothetical protein DHS20C09_01200 [marine bacterium B5-7]
MTHYSVLAVTPINDDWVADYIGSANKTVAKYGDKFLARTASSKSHHFLIEGQDDH